MRAAGDWSRDDSGVAPDMAGSLLRLALWVVDREGKDETGREPFTVGGLWRRARAGARELPPNLSVAHRKPARAQRAAALDWIGRLRLAAGPRGHQSNGTAAESAAASLGHRTSRGQVGDAMTHTNAATRGALMSGGSADQVVLRPGELSITADRADGVLIFTVRGEIDRSEEHTSELQSRGHLVCRLLLEKKKNR